MSRLIESIRIFNGEIQNLALHAARMERSCFEVLDMGKPWDLTDVLSKAEIPGRGLFKCRVVYDEGKISTTFTAYMPREVNSLRVVYDDTISYAHKFTDRATIDAHFNNRSTCDDILIVKNGLVTDSSNANIAFCRGGQWITPASCLLKGTMRQLLISTGRLAEDEIGIQDFAQFQSFRLINAMIRDEAAALDIRRIHF